MTHRIHLVLVSQQATPNITPALDPDFRPQELVLLVSPDMTRQAEALENVLTGYGLRIARWSIEDAWDIEHVRDRVLDLLSEREGENLVLNATGGTKPMSIAAYEAFRHLERPIFYVHPEKDRVVWLYPRRAPHDLKERIRLPAFLQAHGASLEKRGRRNGVSADRRELTASLVKDVHHLGPALAAFNWAAYHARESLVSPPLIAGYRKRSLLRDLGARFEGAGLLRWQGDCLHFANESARLYVNGSWLEEHVYGVLYQLRSQVRAIQDLGCRLEVARRVGGKVVKNELDVSFLADNRLYIIECKTKRFDEVPEIHSRGAEALYKLETLKDLLGGLQARAMLVTYQNLPPADKQRARDLGIRVCNGAEINWLDRVIEAWVK